MLELLYGDWEIMDDGEMIQEPGIKRDRLQFSLLKYHNVRFITSNGDMETFNLELTDVFTDPVRPQYSFQIMIANTLGHDYMML